MPKRILIVDDEEVVRISLEEFLQDCDFDILSVGCAEEALQVLEQDSTFDAAIVDLRMPKMNGEDFILLAKKKYPKMHFIIQTGTFDYQISPALIESGISETHVLKKPVVRLDMFVQILESMLTPS